MPYRQYSEKTSHLIKEHFGLGEPRFEMGESVAWGEDNAGFVLAVQPWDLKLIRFNRENLAFNYRMQGQDNFNHFLCDCECAGYRWVYQVYVDSSTTYFIDESWLIPAGEYVKPHPKLDEDLPFVPEPHPIQAKFTANDMVVWTIPSSDADYPIFLGYGVVVDVTYAAIPEELRIGDDFFGSDSLRTVHRRVPGFYYRIETYETGVTREERASSMWVHESYLLRASTEAYNKFPRLFDHDYHRIDWYGENLEDINRFKKVLGYYPTYLGQMGFDPPQFDLGDYVECSYFDEVLFGEEDVENCGVIVDAIPYYGCFEPHRYLIYCSRQLGMTKVDWEGIGSETTWVYLVAVTTPDGSEVNFFLPQDGLGLLATDEWGVNYYQNELDLTDAEELSAYDFFEDSEDWQILDLTRPLPTPYLLGKYEPHAVTTPDSNIELEYEA